MLSSSGPRAARRRGLRAQGLQWRPPRHPAGRCGYSRPGSGRARAFRCCQTWGCGAGLVAPAMAAEEEAAVKGEAAGGVPRWGRCAGHAGGAPGRARERAAGVASPGGHTLLGEGPSSVSVWLRSRGRSLGRRCGAARRVSSRGLVAAGFRPARSPISLPQAARLGEGELGRDPPPPPGSPPRRVRGLLRALLEFSRLYVNQLSLALRSSGCASPSTLSWSNFQSPRSELLQPVAARWSGERVEAASPYFSPSETTARPRQEAALGFYHYSCRKAVSGVSLFYTSVEFW